MKNKIEVPLKNRETTKRKLLDAVEYIIEKDGFNGLGVNKVARQAGVSKVLIYRYFGGFEPMLKAAMIDEVIWTNYAVENLMLLEIALPLREMINNILVNHFTESYEPGLLKIRALAALDNNKKMIQEIIRNKTFISDNDGDDMIVNS